MAWFILLLAGLFEIVWAYCMKLSDGFSRPFASMMTLIFMVLSFGLLAQAMKMLPLGTAYTIWTGIGAIGSFLLGLLVLGEPITGLRILAALLIMSGLVLMKLVTV